MTSFHFFSAVQTALSKCRTGTSGTYYDDSKNASFRRGPVSLYQYTRKKALRVQKYMAVCLWFRNSPQSLISLPAHRGGHNSHGGWVGSSLRKGLQYCTVFFLYMCTAGISAHSQIGPKFPESMGQRFFLRDSIRSVSKEESRAVGSIAPFLGDRARHAA